MSILIRPLITEKLSRIQDQEGKYTFEVQRNTLQTTSSPNPNRPSGPPRPDFSRTNHNNSVAIWPLRRLATRSPQKYRGSDI